MEGASVAGEPLNALSRGSEMARKAFEKNHLHKVKKKMRKSNSNQSKAASANFRDLSGISGMWEVRTRPDNRMPLAWGRSERGPPCHPFGTILWGEDAFGIQRKFCLSRFSKQP